MEQIRVLLVDDEEEFASALAERLSLRGFAASTCSEGKEAMRMIESSPPDVVLLDMMMPGLGGKEIGAWIRSGYPEVRVVYLTGLDVAVSDSECVECLRKPVSIDELIRKIRSVLATKKPDFS